jgi:hypothetical protein
MPNVLAARPGTLPARGGQYGWRLISVTCEHTDAHVCTKAKALPVTHHIPRLQNTNKTFNRYLSNL